MSETETECALARARHAIDRDRYVVAYCITMIESACRGRQWTLEGRGSYEWDDDGYRKEFGFWLDDVLESLKPLKAVAWDKSDCDNSFERIIAAKKAAKALLSQPRAPRELIAIDLNDDPRDRRIAELEGAFARLTKFIAENFS